MAMTMAFPLPTSLSPTRVASFRDCALAGRFPVDHLPEAPTPWSSKSAPVHGALERLHGGIPDVTGLAFAGAG